MIELDLNALRALAEAADRVAENCLWTEIYEPHAETSVHAEHCLMCNKTNEHLSDCAYLALEDALALPAVQRALKEGQAATPVDNLDIAPSNPCPHCGGGPGCGHNITDMRRYPG